MKIVRFGMQMHETLGLLDDQNKVRSLKGVFDLSNNESIGDQLIIEKLDNIDINSLPIVDSDVRLGVPINNISKLICIGLNYSDHAEEAGMAIPTEPIVFMKSISALTGPNDDVELPKNSSKSDWEVELAFVIGKKTKNVTEAEAMDYVSGYTICNDVSEREWQLEHGTQWSKGKSFDTFAPLGPYFVTKDEIKDPHNLNLWLKLNGQMMQEGNTSKMIFNIPQLISYLSYFVTLYPGDVISTGTPPGVGMGFKPSPIFLKKGDVMELGIENLGSQKQKVI